jgi:uncharacterized protein (DUF1684 family)
MEDYARGVNEWRQLREQRLKAPDGWLTLVDRILLDEGENQLPIGTITLREGAARLRAAPGVTLDGQPAGERVLRSQEGARADSLQFEGRTYELFRRGDAFAVRVKDPRSPALLGYAGLEHFPIDERWRLVARWERYQPPRTTLHQFDIGPGWERQVPGIARFTLEGLDLALEPVLEEDSRRLFFVFADQTNRTESYPAGRFLYATLPRGDEVELDFNLAFNPPCAFSAFATCPLTPSQNRLAVRVPAGEKRYTHSD